MFLSAAHGLLRAVVSDQLFFYVVVALDAIVGFMPFIRRVSMAFAVVHSVYTLFGMIFGIYTVPAVMRIPQAHFLTPLHT